ncbi:hypothetical protein ACDP95_02135 [Weissella confusa]
MRLFRGPRLVLRQLASRRTKHLFVGILIVGGFFYPTFLIHWPYSWELIYKLDDFYAGNPGVVVTVLTGLTVFLVNYADRMTERTERAERMFLKMYVEFAELHEDDYFISDQADIKLTISDVAVIDQLLSFTKFVIHNDVCYRNLAQQIGPRYLQMYGFYEGLNNTHQNDVNIWLITLTVEELEANKQLGQIFVDELKHRGKRNV